MRRRDSRGVDVRGEGPEEGSEMSLLVKEMMTRNPITIGSDALLATAVAVTGPFRASSSA